LGINEEYNNCNSMIRVGNGGFCSMVDEEISEKTTNVAAENLKKKENETRHQFHL